MARRKPSRRTQNERFQGGREVASEWITIAGRRYQLLEQLSVPNRGRWRIWDPHPRPRGTVKTAIVLTDNVESEQLRRSLMRVPKDHSGIPRIESCERKEGKLTMVLSWSQGVNVRDYLERFKSGGVSPISVYEAIRRIRSLAHSLSVLHRYCGIIHGDIKPENLILPSDPGSIALIDFGSSWQIERTATRLVGDGTNEFYSSPEVFAELSKADGRSDQFSAGVVLYEMLTLKLPYAGIGGKAGNPLYRDAADAYEPPSLNIANKDKVPKQLVAMIDDVVETAVKINPDHRFPSTKKFAESLDEIYLMFRTSAPQPSHRNETLMQTFRRWWSS